MMRKGSKRFPNKMMKQFLGKPLYKWTLEFAEKTGFPVYFLHDYEERLSGPETYEIKRLPEFAGDKHRTAEEILWAEIVADVYVLLQATTPLRDQNTFLGALGYFSSDIRMKSALAVRELKKGYYYSKDGIPITFDQRERTYNGCEKKSIFQETGSFYFFKREQLFKKHILDCRNSEKMLVIDNSGFDIDTEKDLKEAEIWAKDLS